MVLPTQNTTAHNARRTSVMEQEQDKLSEYNENYIDTPKLTEC